MRHLSFPKTKRNKTPGVVFLLASAGAVPGGAPMLLQLASHLRRAGYFVAAALTRPFDFEGRRKLEEADALIEALEDVAQLTVRF
jgi:cell division GTPase FtsZ